MAILFLWGQIKNVTAQCTQNFSWASWSNFTGKTATGTVMVGSKSVSVEMVSNFDFGATSSIFNHAAFSRFESPVPNTTVPRTTWAAGPGGTTTMCFSEEVENPVLLLASLGAGGLTVDLSFSEPYLVAFNGSGMVYPNDTTIRGTEGYAIIMFPGKFKCVTIHSTTPEFYTNITWGLNPPKFPVTISGATTGCDSVVLTASGGVTYRWSGGTYPTAARNVFTNDGTYNLTVTDNNNCTVSTLKTVAIKKGTRATEAITICQGQSYRGHTTSGTYTDIVQGINGCDSTISLTLTVNPAPRTTLDKKICHWDTYEGYSTTGIYLDTFKTAGGCDSIRTLNLTVTGEILTTIDTSICAGQKVEGYHVSGTYRDVFNVTSVDCDSVRILNLTVIPAPKTTVRHTICPGQSYLGYNQTGTYIDTFSTPSGCDSIRTLQLLVTQELKSVAYQLICAGEVFEGYTTSGEYIDTFKTAGGCDSIRILTLDVRQPPVINFPPESFICPGRTLRLYPGAFTQYRWQDGSTDTAFVVTEPGLYSVAVSNICGTAQASVNVVTGNCNLYFANAFTPNGDGKNDRFRPLNASGLQQFHLVVYDRWGHLVFQTKDAAGGWDGRVNGKEVPAGVFAWHCRYFSENKEMVQKGTVVLIR